MANILDSLKEFITPELISKASETYGESSSAVTKGLDSLLPTVLSGLTQKSNDGSFGDIFDMIKGGAAKNPGLMDNLGSLIGGGNLAQNDPKDLSGRLMSSIFGNKVGGILDLVSSVAGLKRSSSSGLMGFVGPLVMSYLGRVIKNKALDAVGLGKFLRNDSSAFSRALPAGMGDLLGLGFAKNTGDAAKRVTSSVRETASSTTRAAKETASTAANTVTRTASTAANTVEKSSGGFLKWLLPIALLAGLGWFFGMRSCGDVGNVVDKTAGAVGDVTKDAAGAVGDVAGKVGDVAGGAADMAKDAAGKVGDAAAGAVGALGDFFKRTLPGGLELNIPKFGIENKLIDFVAGSAAISKEAWMDFDRITFNTGSASIDMEKSGEQIGNIAQILKAYPNVKIKLGGYTDNTGSAEGNLKLSQARADAVKAALVAKVIDATRIETEGYGAAHPVASNDTEEGRAKNRRIAVNVTAK